LLCNSNLLYIKARSLQILYLIEENGRNMSQEKIIGVGVLGLVAGMLGGIPALSMAATVYVTDAANLRTACGNLTTLSTSPDNVELKATGTCLGSNSSGSVTQAVPVTGITVTEGNSQTVDIANYGVTVKLPFSVTSTTQPTLGAVNSLISSRFTYIAPAAGTIGTTAQTTSFNYSIQDASGGTSTSSVSITVNPGTTGGGGGSGTCVSTATLKCKGVISLANVADRGNQLSPGITDVWEFTYDSSRVGIFNHTHGYQKIGIISATPDESMTNALPGYCTQNPWNTEASFSFNEQSLATQWECPLVNGQTYYLKLKLTGSTADADYYLNTGSTTQ
jgi:hypothetical protein